METGAEATQERIQLEARTREVTQLRMDLDQALMMGAAKDKLIADLQRRCVHNSPLTVISARSVLEVMSGDMSIHAGGGSVDMLCGVAR